MLAPLLFTWLVDAAFRRARTTPYARWFVFQFACRVGVGDPDEFHWITKVDPAAVPRFGNQRAILVTVL
jgi:hypothetical protein